MRGLHIEISPGSFLARFFTAPGRAGNQIILSGGRGSGKTSWCLALSERAHQGGISVSGLVSPYNLHAGQRVSIDLLDLSSGERRRLAEPCNPDQADPSALQTGKWQFLPESLAWGNACLAALDPVRLAAGLLIMDELGPLEFEHAQGLQKGMEIFAARQARLSIAVVRPELLPAAKERWPAAEVLFVPAQAEEMEGQQ